MPDCQRLLGTSSEARIRALLHILANVCSAGDPLINSPRESKVARCGGSHTGQVTDENCKALTILVFGAAEFGRIFDYYTQ